MTLIMHALFATVRRRDWVVSLATVIVIVRIAEVCHYHAIKVSEDEGLDAVSGSPSRIRFEMKESKQLKPLPVPAERIKTTVVMFIPSPIPWAKRREYVYHEFAKEGWRREQVVLLFVFGNRTTDTPPTKHLLATNVFVPCSDYGDAYDDTNDASSTTCKVYEGLRYIVARFEARYVWRGSDDAYVNLRYFFSSVMPTLPSSRLYFGRLRTAHKLTDDLLLSNQPRLASLFGLYQFGQYMVGSGYLLSFDVADFIGSLKIQPHLTWCEDVMVGMWLNPFQVTFMHSMQYIDQPGQLAKPGTDYVLIHRMRPDQWASIGRDGRLLHSFERT